MGAMDCRVFMKTMDSIESMAFPVSIPFHPWNPSSFKEFQLIFNGISINTMDAMETMDSVQSMRFPLVRAELEACLLGAMASGDVKAPTAIEWFAMKKYCFHFVFQSFQIEI